MERKIGEIFEYNGEWYQCVEDSLDNCVNCCFYNGGHKKCSDKMGECFKERRSDNNGVYFKKLEKVGEPYEFDGHLFQSYHTFEVPIFTENYATVREFGNNSKISIEIKQTKEDMEEKKIKLSQDDIDWLKKQIRWAALPGYITHEEDYDRATEEIMNLFISSDTEHSSSEKIGKNLKPFDLEAAKAGKPVCTRDGRKARIICFDYNGETGDYPIVALVHYNKGNKCYERVLKYTSDGLFNKYGDCQHDDDLMMLPEKKEGWVNVYKERIYSTKEEAIEATYDGVTYVDTVKISWEE